MCARTRAHTPNPIGQAGGMNLYPYVMSNPINSKDSFGLAEITIDFGGASATGIPFLGFGLLLLLYRVFGKAKTNRKNK